MVRWAVKCSFRHASCCRVLVMKGGDGCRETLFFFTWDTEYAAFFS